MSNTTDILLITLSNWGSAPEKALVDAARRTAKVRAKARRKNPGLYGKRAGAKEAGFLKEPNKTNAMALVMETLKAQVQLDVPIGV